MEISLEVVCPYCYQITCVEVDSSQFQLQFIEDCQVCCRPIKFTIRCKGGEITDYFADREMS